MGHSPIKGGSRGTFEGKTKHGIQYYILSVAKGLSEGLIHRNEAKAKGFALLDEPVVQGLIRGFRVADGDLVPEMVKMTGSNKTISTVVAGTTKDEDPWVRVRRVNLRLGDGGSDRKAGEFHELVDRKPQRAHEIVVDRQRILHKESIKRIS